MFDAKIKDQSFFPIFRYVLKSVDNDGNEHLNEEKIHILIGNIHSFHLKKIYYLKTKLFCMKM